MSGEQLDTESPNKENGVPITLVTKNPLLIPPKNKWRVAQIEATLGVVSQIYEWVVEIGEEPVVVIDTRRLCKAIEIANKHNRDWRVGDRPYLIFDDRGVLIYNPYKHAKRPDEEED